MHDNNPPAGGESGQHPGGRVYAKPVLKVYGPVAALTGAVDMTGMADGGPNNTRT
jgi:hypothetical protein